MRGKNNRELICKMYVEDKYSTVQIGKIVGLSPGAVASVLEHLHIQLRTSKEAVHLRFPNGRFGKNAANWKGGRRPANNKGYIYIHSPQHPYATKEGYVMEHRLVMEKILGRYLLPTEMVHHKNRNKADNRPENLELVSSHKEHSNKYFAANQEVFRLQQLLTDHHIPF